MSKGSHAFHEIFLHLNWHCYQDQRLLTPRLQPMVFDFISNYCSGYKGVYLLGIGGIQDHLHMAIEIEPTVTIDQLVGQIKGASSYAINQAAGTKALRWQRGYGVVSFAKANLAGILKYIDLQEEHHAKGSVKQKLEICDSMEEEWEEPDHAAEAREAKPARSRLRRNG